MSTASTAQRARPASPDLERLPTPPGRPGLPLIGESVDFIRSPNAFVSTRRAKYGPIFSANLLGKRTVFMAGAEANAWIFAGEGKYLQNEWPPARALLGTSCMALLTGERHKQRRQLLAPHFRRASIDACVPGIVSIARKHMQRWQTDAELGPVAMNVRVRALAFEIAANYLLGDVGELGVPLDDYSRDFDLMLDGLFVPFALAIPGTRFAAAGQARARLETVTDDLVMRRDASTRRGPDVLSTLLDIRDEHGEMLPRDTIVDELLLLLFAGLDTTATATANVIYHLATLPEIALRARTEQDEQTEPRFSLATVQAMTYLGAVIKESMRLIPPLAGSFRVMTHDAEYGGFRLPRGWRICVRAALVHDDPGYYPEPERFEPRRWLGEDDRPPFAYIPFGGGPRTCIGQHFAQLEMHIVLAMLLRRFTWTLSEGQDTSFTELPTPMMRSGLLLDLRGTRPPESPRAYSARDQRDPQARDPRRYRTPQ